MIFILSQKYDYTTEIIIEYLNYYGLKHIKHLYENEISELTINICNKNLNYDFKYKNRNLEKLELSKKSIFWFRRGAFQYTLSLKNKSNFIQKYLELEYNHIHESIFKNHSFDLSFNDEYLNNKIYNLNLARKIGFKIPETLISTEKQNIIEFLNKYERVISKPINNFHPNGALNKKSRIKSVGTILINKEIIESLPDSFCPSFIEVCDFDTILKHPANAGQVIQCVKRNKYLIPNTPDTQKEEIFAIQNIFGKPLG